MEKIPRITKHIKIDDEMVKKYDEKNFKHKLIEPQT